MRRRPTAYEFSLVSVAGAFIASLIIHQDDMAVVLLAILIIVHFYEFVFAPDRDHI